jgi:hypothetical protein
MAEFNSLSLNPHPVPPNVLSGWKDIANYLGKGVRTAQRYERELRLPVRRPAGKSRGSVLATRADLDEWVSQSPMMTPPDHANGTSQPRGNLSRGVLVLRSLCTEARELHSAIGTQRAALKSGIDRLVQTLGELAPPEAEGYRTTAIEQKERAIEMTLIARRMCDRAIEMRKPANRRPIVNC